MYATGKAYTVNKVGRPHSIPGCAPLGIAAVAVAAPIAASGCTALQPRPPGSPPSSTSDPSSRSLLRASRWLEGTAGTRGRGSSSSEAASCLPSRELPPAKRAERQGGKIDVEQETFDTLMVVRKDLL